MSWWRRRREDRKVLERLDEIHTLAKLGIGTCVFREVQNEDFGACEGEITCWYKPPSGEGKYSLMMQVCVAHAVMMNVGPDDGWERRAIEDMPDPNTASGYGVAEVE